MKTAEVFSLKQNCCSKNNLMGSSSTLKYFRYRWPVGVNFYILNCRGTSNWDKRPRYFFGLNSVWTVPGRTDFMKNKSSCLKRKTLASLNISFGRWPTGLNIIDSNLTMEILWKYIFFLTTNQVWAGILQFKRNNRTHASRGVHVP